MTKIEYIQPEGMFASPIYTQAVKVSDGALLFVSGQVAYDADANVLSPNDLHAQAHHAIDNLERVFSASNATWDNVIKLTVYVVNFNPAIERSIVLNVLKERITSNRPPANTLLGIQSLAREGLRIEIEAIVAVD